MDKDFLLKTYAQCHGPEAGPWNLSVENKYLEYLFAKFFEDFFPVPWEAKFCNIGIGAGMWDRYLSYRLRGGGLVSIDRDELCCRQLREGLALEGNPNPVEVICADVMSLEYEGCFDIVTMVGSTKWESGQGAAILEKAISFVKPGGSLYYQSLDPNEDVHGVEEVCKCCKMKMEQYFREKTGELTAHFWKFSR